MPISVCFMTGDKITFKESKLNCLTVFTRVANLYKVPLRCISIYQFDCEDDLGTIEDYQFVDNSNCYYGMLKPVDVNSNTYGDDVKIFNNKILDACKTQKISFNKYISNYHEDLCYALDYKAIQWLKTNIPNLILNNAATDCYTSQTPQQSNKMFDFKKLKKNIINTNLADSYTSFIEDTFDKIIREELEYKYETPNMIKWLKSTILYEVGFDTDVYDTY